MDNEKEEVMTGKTQRGSSLIRALSIIAAVAALAVSNGIICILIG